MNSDHKIRFKSQTNQKIILIVVEAQFFQKLAKKN